MFWGSLFGKEKGPYLFWEKEWGSITAAGYSDNVVPLISSVVLREPGLHLLHLMQDNALTHKANKTMREFKRRTISPFDWSQYSPDLNPFESVWKYIKDYIQSGYQEQDQGRQRSQRAILPNSERHMGSGV